MRPLFYALLCLAPVYLASGADNSATAQPGTTELTPGITLTNIKEIARVTGDPMEGETIPSPNNTGADYDFYATDLGIMWHMGGKRIGMFFGDSNGAGFVAGKGGGNGSNWRSNALAFSDDVRLDDGLSINSMAVDDEGKAREICAGAKANPSVYQTSIPTGAIRAGNRDYVHYMNIYDWAGGNGRWLTNFSSLYSSGDDGKIWKREEAVTFAPDSRFSQVTYAKKDGYVYMIGTQSGRGSAAWLARFAEKDILDMKKYEYWNGEKGQWIAGDESVATPVIPAPVGEASLMYHKKYKRWIITYNYDAAYDPAVKKKWHAIMYRDTDDITRWGEKKVLLDQDRYEGLYCAYMHPLKNDGDKIYFLMSLWKPYNVFLMSADIDYKH